MATQTVVVDSAGDAVGRGSVRRQRRRCGDGRVRGCHVDGERLRRRRRRDAAGGGRRCLVIGNDASDVSTGGEPRGGRPGRTTVGSHPARQTRRHMAACQMNDPCAGPANFLTASLALAFRRICARRCGPSPTASDIVPNRALQILDNCCQPLTTRTSTTDQLIALRCLQPGFRLPRRGRSTVIPAGRGRRRRRSQDGPRCRHPG